jgi:hypothetical protein
MFFLRLVRYVLVARLGLDGWQSGVYSPERGEEGKVRVRWNWWGKQTVAYVLALVVMKGAVIVIFALLPVIFKFGSWVLAWLGPKGQIVFVMVRLNRQPSQRVV